MSEEYVRCPECGGFIGKGSCICKLRKEMIQKMAACIGTTPERVEEMIENGEIYPTAHHSAPVDDDIITTHDFTFKAVSKLPEEKQG